MINYCKTATVTGKVFDLCQIYLKLHITILWWKVKNAVMKCKRMLYILFDHFSFLCSIWTWKVIGVTLHTDLQCDIILIWLLVKANCHLHPTLKIQMKLFPPLLPDQLKICQVVFWLSSHTLNHHIKASGFWQWY